MPSKAEVKIIRSLKYKKYRKQHGLFIAEGPHLVDSLMESSFRLSRLYATEEGLARLSVPVPDEKLSMVKPDVLKGLSSLSTDQGLLATVALPTCDFGPALAEERWVVGVDGIQDPGNLGTIIRTADWFGFPYLLCSPTTVDAFNPKVVQASMGSIFHTAIRYAELPVFAGYSSAPVYSLTKNGQDFYKTQWPKAGVIVVGHETHGVSEALESRVTQEVRIPGFGQAESLNAAIATAVTLSQLRGYLDARF